MKMHDVIRFHDDGDSDEINESDLQFQKDDDPGIPT
jgi:hypothetical protein